MQVRFPDGSIMICGILGRDAEYKTVGNKGSSLTTFSVKVGEREENGETKAIWVNCQCWHELARYSAGLRKLDTALCIGRIKQNGEYKNFECEFVLRQPTEDERHDIAELLNKPNTSGNSEPYGEDFDPFGDAENLF